MGETADGIGDILTGGIFARTLDRVRGGGAAGHGGLDGAGGTCLNCGAVRAGGFCQDCGQSGHVHRTMMSLGHDIAHGVFHFEGRIWQTVPMLALHPGQLTRRYVHGERAKFVSPMALFLFSVFLLFAAITRISMPDVAGAAQGMAKAKAQMADEFEKTNDKLDDLKEKKADRLDDDPKADTRDLDKQIQQTQQEAAVLKSVAARFPGSDSVAKPPTAPPPGIMANPGVPDLSDVAKSAGLSDGDGKFTTSIPGLDRQISMVNANRALFVYKLESAASKFSWALIPISLPFIWLLFFWRRDVGLYDHAIFAFHSLSFMTLLVVGLIGLDLIGVRQAWLWLALIFVPPIHMYKHLRGAYLVGRTGAAWRTGALLLMTSITSVLFFILLLWLEAS
jgi:hypothetical protein